MLNVTFDPSRPAERGQYYVELIDIKVDRANRLGYWCDKEHLRHMAHAILGQFRFELIEGLIGR